MLWAAKEGKFGRLINQCLQTIRIPIRNAVANGDLSADPFYATEKAYHKEKPMGVLTLAEREQIKQAKVTDYYARLSVLLGLLCGMRLGEVRGLRWGDIGDGIITIRHNWVEGDGAKNPKRKDGLIQENTRKVPMPRLIANLLNSIINKPPLKKPLYTEPNDFVIRTNRSERDLPVSFKYFAHALNRELSAVGMPGKWPPCKKRKP